MVMLKWWVLAASVALLAAAVVVAVLRPWQPLGVPTPAGIPYSLGECHPSGSPVGAAGYNAIAASAWDPMFIGADVGASVPLGTGRSVWLFGDTSRLVDGTVVPAVRNSMLITGDACFSVVIPAGAGAVIPDRPDGVGYWPMDAIARPGDGVTTLFVTAERVSGKEEMFDFTNPGPAIATFQITDAGTVYYQGVVDLGSDDPSRANVGWGSAVVDGGDGWWYVYGTANPDEPLVLGWSVRVARVHPETFADTTTWEYFDGRAWVADSHAAVELIPAEHGVSQTFSVFERDGVWYAVSKLDGDFGRNLALWAAPHPWGPFRRPTVVGTVPNRDDLSVIRYMPVAHPEVAQAGPDTIVISVSRNSTDARLLAERPDLYRPFFVDIPLPPRHSHRFLDPLTFGGS